MAGSGKRAATIERRTSETHIELALDLAGGEVDVATGIGFLDHMLELLGRHGGLGLWVRASGDLETGSHHTVEDVGITFGQALDSALGDRAGITRYGHVELPMDESLGRCSIDISGRPYCRFVSDLPPVTIAGFEAERTRGHVTASWLSHQVGQNLDPESIIVSELVNTAGFNRTQPGTLFNAGGSSLGWAAPAAIGAKVAAPDRQIVACTGDGSWMFGNPQVVTWASAFHKAPRQQTRTAKLLSVLFIEPIHPARSFGFARDVREFRYRRLHTEGKLVVRHSGFHFRKAVVPLQRPAIQIAQKVQL